MKLDYINSLISGIVFFKIGKEYIHVKPPSAEDKAFADFFSQEQYDDALIDGIWTQEEAEQHLISMGYLPKEYSDKLEEIDKNIDNMKVDYFNHFYDSNAKDYIKRNITKQQDRHDELYAKRYVFYDKTCDYLKRYCFTSYLLQKYAFNQDNELCYKYYSIQAIHNKYITVNNDIGSKIREIAKTNEWKNRWYSSKLNAFHNEPSSLTDMQLSIISWSTYYDGIFQSFDKPSDEIIEDDIALDGWSILEKRKRKKEEQQRNAEKMLPDNLKNSGEVFIPARTQKRAKDIMSLNESESLHKIRSLKQDLKENAIVNESDLTSTRRELQMQAIQMQKENRRK